MYRAGSLRAMEEEMSIYCYKLDIMGVQVRWDRGGTLAGKSEGKRPLGRPRRRWVNNIKMDLREIGWGGLDWIDLAEDGDQWRALVNTVMNLRVP
jgi:hypothetical protein